MRDAYDAFFFYDGGSPTPLQNVSPVATSCRFMMSRESSKSEILSFRSPRENARIEETAAHISSSNGDTTNS